MKINYHASFEANATRRAFARMHLALTGQTGKSGHIVQCLADLAPNQGIVFASGTTVKVGCWSFLLSSR